MSKSNELKPKYSYKTDSEVVIQFLSQRKMALTFGIILGQTWGFPVPQIIIKSSLSRWSLNRHFGKNITVLSSVATVVFL